MLLGWTVAALLSVSSHQARGVRLLSTPLPLQRWLAHARNTAEPPTAAHLLLAANKTAHPQALSALLSTAAEQDDASRYLSHRQAWLNYTCTRGGCANLLADVVRRLQPRAGAWSVVYVAEAEAAPPAQIAALFTRFWGAARCSHATAEGLISVDCRRTLFVLSTSLGESVAEEEGLDALDADETLPPPTASTDGGGEAVATSSLRPLRERVLREAMPWIKAVDESAGTRRCAGALRAAFAVVVGERDGGGSFGALIERQTAERNARRCQRGSAAAIEVEGGCCDDGANASAPSCAAAAKNGTHKSTLKERFAVLDQLLGQESVVSEIRARLEAIESGADGGEDAHVFFFYGFPGTGKSFLAELLAEARYGTTRPPFYAKYAMQNYKTEEDMWKLISPPCGVKGEGAFAALFAIDAVSARGGAGPVVVFDEIEEARSNFMTSALVNAIDHKGFIEYSAKRSDGSCATFHAPTAGSLIILTSNCFLDELSDALARHSANGSSAAGSRSPADVYRDVRDEMEERIFSGGLKCDSDAGSSRLNPFAARKMRDRMQGNTYPFLPLDNEQTMRAFEKQLERRASLYEANGVSLFWTRGFVRLSALLPSQSVRKRLDMLMRLNPRSVERLYAEGVSSCGGERMRRLVLYVRDGEPMGAATCESDILREVGATPLPASDDRHKTVAAITVDANARFADGDTSDGEPPLAPFTASPATDVSRDATHHTESSLQQQVDSLRAELLNAALRHEVEVQDLKDKLAELQVALWRYKLALVLAVLTVALLLAVITLGAAHAVTAYFAVVKGAMLATTVVAASLVAIALVAVVLCQLGSPIACTIGQVLAYVAQSLWWTLSWLWSLAMIVLGPWGRALALAILLLSWIASARFAQRREEGRISEKRAAARELSAKRRLCFDLGMLEGELRALEVQLVFSAYRADAPPRAAHSELAMSSVQRLDGFCNERRRKAAASLLQRSWKRLRSKERGLPVEYQM